MTLFVNKAAVASELHGNLTWGAAQAGVAAGVVDAVASGTIDATDVGELCLIVAVWVDPAATNADLIFTHNRSATSSALLAGARGEPEIAAVLAEGNTPWNPYFTPTRHDPS